MTDMGKAFASIAYDVVRLHGMNSNKMCVGYQIYCDDNTVRGSADEAADLEQLVKMGYLRKFVGSPYKNNKGRNWRYRFMVRNVNFGLTAKGWAVAEQYITAAYSAAEFKRLSEYKHKTAAEEIASVTAIDDWDDFVTD